MRVVPGVGRTAQPSLGESRRDTSVNAFRSIGTVVLLGVFLSGCAQEPTFRGTALDPPRAVRDFALRDQFGMRVIFCFTITLGRKAVRIIKQNITLSLAIKALFLALAIPGYATLWMAVGADMGASLLVVFNGLRLLQTKF